MPGDVCRRLLATEPAVQAFTFEVFSGRLFEPMGLIEETASQGLEARVAAVLLRRSEGEAAIAVTQEQIARHLATSREVVSRVLRGLVARRLIAIAQGRIVLLDAAALAALADQPPRKPLPCSMPPPRSRWGRWRSPPASSPSRSNW